MQNPTDFRSIRQAATSVIRHSFTALRVQIQQEMKLCPVFFGTAYLTPVATFWQDFCHERSKAPESRGTVGFCRLHWRHDWLFGVFLVAAILIAYGPPCTPDTSGTTMPI